MSAHGLKCGRSSVLHPQAPVRLHPTRLQQRPRPLSLPDESVLFQFSGEITQNFKQSRSRRKTRKKRTRRGGKVVGDAAGVLWGGGAPSPAPEGGEWTDVRTLSRVRMSASHPFHLKLKDMHLVETYSKKTNLLQKMAKNKCHGCIKLEEHINLAREIKRHSEEVNALKYQMSDEALQQMPDFQGRIDVLKEIGCIDADLVQIKGRVACEMNSGEELICTECLFENQLDDLEPEEAVALMSSFVFQQKNTSEPSLTPKLSMAKERLYNTAITLGEL
ncbi:hypothetical protein ACLB2K_030076 [Fragaria x ananassa]